MLKSAEAAGNLPWALEELADLIARRSRDRIATVARMILPVVVLVLAAPVAFFGVAIMAPLVRLSETLAQ